MYSCGPQRHVFAATGFGTPPGGSSPTAPKAIIEVIGFNGDGTVDTPKVTLNFNGGAPNFDIYFDPSGDSEISLIQTDKGNGFRGTATRRAH